MPRKELTHQKNQNIILIMKMGDHQIIEQRQNREQEVHLKSCHQYHHSLQVNKHLEIEINQNMITQNQSMNLKVTQEGHQILNHLITE